MACVQRVVSALGVATVVLVATSEVAVVGATAAEALCQEQDDCAAVESNLLLTKTDHRRTIVLNTASCGAVGFIRGKAIPGKSPIQGQADIAYMKEAQCAEMCGKEAGCIRYEFRNKGQFGRCKLYSGITAGKWWWLGNASCSPEQWPCSVFGMAAERFPANWVREVVDNEAACRERCAGSSTQCLEYMYNNVSRDCVHLPAGLKYSKIWRNGPPDTQCHGREPWRADNSQMLAAAQPTFAPTDAAQSTPSSTTPALAQPTSAPTDAAQSTPSSTTPALKEMLLDCKNAQPLRVRQEIRQVDGQRWSRLKAAWSKLGLGNPPLYDYFGTRHAKDNKQLHGRYTFLPAHRALSMDLENMLRQQAMLDGDNSCDLTLPYWDWTERNMKEILSPNFLGTTDQNMCIQDGLGAGFSTPENWRSKNNADYAVAPVVNGRTCVTRKVKWQNEKKLHSAPQLYATREEKDIHRFNMVQKDRHNQMHGTLGGNMGSRVGDHSSSDPAFFFHHNFHDYLWFRWQKYFQLHRSAEQYVEYWQNKVKGEQADMVNDNLLSVAHLWVSNYDIGKDCVEVPGSTGNINQMVCLRYQDSAWAAANQP